MRLALEKEKTVQTAIQEGLTFLYENQLPTGEFRSYWSMHPTMEDEGTLDSSPFPTALIAYSLSFSDSPVAREMIRRAVRFLKAEMLDRGVWRYWTPKHPYYKNIPPDIDDTACASIVLRQEGVDFPDNLQLMLENRDRDGRFYTWFAPRLSPSSCLDYWRVVFNQNPFRLIAFFLMHKAANPSDIDGVVNANALYYAGKSKATRPVIDYLIGIIRQRKEQICDKWHLSPFNFYYSLSRNFMAGMTEFQAVRGTVIRRIKESFKTTGMFGMNALDTSLAACSLLNWKDGSPELDRAIQTLVDQQGEEGSWTRHAFYYGGPNYGGPDEYFAWGSEELTTGFCLEALIRYSRLTRGQAPGVGS